MSDKKLTFNLYAMNILSYEAGNLKAIGKGSSARPVCALMLSNEENKHKVKVLFKGEQAKKVHKYMTTRRSLGIVQDESIYMTGEYRELRKDCVVMECIGPVYFSSFIGV
jgi:hypothetical protein